MACVTYIGPGGAGHYVKMVHNGIEYGDMQLIAEAYDLLKMAWGLTINNFLMFYRMECYRGTQFLLIEITADIFKYIDPDTNHALVDVILDATGQKGTGRWTVQSALELGVCIPTITAAVNARIMSSYKKERVAASEVLTGPTGKYEEIPSHLSTLSAMPSIAQKFAPMPKDGAVRYGVNGLSL
jgi:6-phosphogluconate dehydrogenase